MWEQLHKLYDLTNALRAGGLSPQFTLRRVILLGDWCAGKSSVLNSLLEMDLAPRNLVTMEMTDCLVCLSEVSARSTFTSRR